MAKSTQTRALALHTSWGGSAPGPGNRQENVQKKMCSSTVFVLSSVIKLPRIVFVCPPRLACVNWVLTCYFKSPHSGQSFKGHIKTISLLCWDSWQLMKMLQNRQNPWKYITQFLQTEGSHPQHPPPAIFLLRYCLHRFNQLCHWGTAKMAMWPAEI